MRFNDTEQNLNHTHIPLLEAVGISLFYKNKKALDNINFKLSFGETLFVTGESGAGKTSLLKILSGKLRPSSGELVWKDGKPRISSVNQEIKLLEKFSIIDNLWVAFQANYHGSYRQFENEALELAKYFHVFEKLDTPVKEANGGLRQTIAIMRALISRPEVLILDEPTKSLDEKNAIKTFELLSYYCKKKQLSVIWASHNRSLIKKFSGKMIHIENGQVVYSGQACFI